MTLNINGWEKLKSLQVYTVWLNVRIRVVFYYPTAIPRNTQGNIGLTFKLEVFLVPQYRHVIHISKDEAL